MFSLNRTFYGVEKTAPNIFAFSSNSNFFVEFEKGASFEARPSKVKNGTREKVSKAFDRVASVSFFMASKFSGFNILLKERLVKCKNFLALQSRPSIRINV